MHAVHWKNFAQKNCFIYGNYKSNYEILCISVNTHKLFKMQFFANAQLCCGRQKSALIPFL